MAPRFRGEVPSQESVGGVQIPEVGTERAKEHGRRGIVVVPTPCAEVYIPLPAPYARRYGPAAALDTRERSSGRSTPRWLPQLPAYTWLRWPARNEPKVVSRIGPSLGGGAVRAGTAPKCQVVRRGAEPLTARAPAGQSDRSAHGKLRARGHTLLIKFAVARHIPVLWKERRRQGHLGVGPGAIHIGVRGVGGPRPRWSRGGGRRARQRPIGAPASCPISTRVGVSFGARPCSSRILARTDATGSLALTTVAVGRYPSAVSAGTHSNRRGCTSDERCIERSMTHEHDAAVASRRKLMPDQQGVG